MLSVAAQTFPLQPIYYASYSPINHHHHQQGQHYQQPFYPRESPPMCDPIIMGSSPPLPVSVVSPDPRSQQQDAAVAQALEIARESPDGAQDPTVSKILEQALSNIWAKVEAQPGSYVMTRDEFAVFNFFQCRFLGNTTAIMARRRYWDNTHA